MIHEKSIRGAYWCDDNCNMWSVGTHTKEDAEKASASLSECTNCVDCYNCGFCHNCVECQACENCFSCRGCKDCSRCCCCWDCRCCKDCQSCQICHKCDKCHMCVKCENSKKSICCQSCYDCTSCDKCMSCHEAVCCTASHNIYKRKGARYSYTPYNPIFDTFSPSDGEELKIKKELENEKKC